MAADLNADFAGDPSSNVAQTSEALHFSSRAGLLLGALAIICWSFGAALVFLGAQQTGLWPFVTIASLTGGILQLIARQLTHGELRSALLLPWRLWVGPVLCFVLYGLAWPFALATSTTRQVVGVSLINYLWPVLTVFFSVWWVPGVRLTPRLIAAFGLALAGLALANYKNLQDLFSGLSGHAPTLRHFLPYILAAVAAITWAVYSVLLVLWRSWARNCITSPIGFILIGLIGGLVMIATDTLPRALTGLGTLMTVLYGVGPLAAGYLLWELALPKARVQTLSLFAAAIPVLSTLLLCFCVHRPPGVELLCAVALLAGAVVLSLWEK